METFVLRNGVQVPAIGFGTWQTPDGATAVDAVKEAIKDGYRHIDTAAAYDNEESVGRGVRESGVDRGELFLATKAWNGARGYESTLNAFEESCAKLGVDYVDLYLMHWPANAKQFGEDADRINLDTWRAMTELYHTGKVRAIGVCNFLPKHLGPLMDTEIPPMVDQIEFHPGVTWPQTVEFCNAHHIQVEAWSPLGSGRVLNDPRLEKIAAKYGKSVAQLCIRWCLQHDALPLPKSVTPARIAANLDVFDFDISQADMDAIDSMEPFGFSGNHTDEVDF